MNSTWNWHQAILGKVDGEFREAYLREDKTQAQVFIAITAVWVLGYIYVEYQLLNADLRFYLMLAFRLLFFSVSSWLFLKLPQINDLDMVDFALLGWSVAAVSLVTVSNLGLNDINLNRINFNLAWVLGCYLIPIKHIYRTIPALLVSLLSIYMFLSYGNIHPQNITISVIVAKTGTIFAINAIGFTLGLRRESQRYHQYLIQKTLTEGQAKLKELATSDSLTGVFNRRSFLEIATTEFDRYQRYGETFSFAILDLDDLKSINDAHGHPAGDHALILLTETIKAQKRSSDTFGRLAGDEFGLLLPNTNADRAQEVLERVKSALAETIVEVSNEQQFQVRYSAGVAEVRKTDENFDALYKRADKGLFLAKQSGRDQSATA